MLSISSVQYADFPQQLVLNTLARYSARVSVFWKYLFQL